MIGELHKLLDNGFNVVLQKCGNEYIAHAIKHQFGDSLAPLLRVEQPSGRSKKLESAVNVLESEAFKKKAMRKKPPENDS